MYRVQNRFLQFGLILFDNFVDPILPLVTSFVNLVIIAISQVVYTISDIEFEIKKRIQICHFVPPFVAII